MVVVVVGSVTWKLHSGRRAGQLVEEEIGVAAAEVAQGYRRDAAGGTESETGVKRGVDTSGMGWGVNEEQT